MLVFMSSTLYSCPILMKLAYSRQILEKYSNVKFHENPSSGADGGTELRDESNSSFSQYCERTSKSNDVSKDGVIKSM